MAMDRLQTTKLSFAFLLFSAPVANAYDFTPTESEWLAWPEYCKARYVTTLWGARSKYSTRYPRGAVDQWSSKLGPFFTHAHHYCAGLVYLQRIPTSISEHEREVLVTHANGEMAYAYDRVSVSNFMYPEVALNFAQAKVHAGENREALDLLQKSVYERPEYASSYAMMSIIYRDIGDKDAQLSVLEQGNDALGGSSAELHYFLGLLYLDRGNTDQAALHARNAYDLGYPLPGLRNKLQKNGVLLDLDN